jgi:hypothetical protein
VDSLVPSLFVLAAASIILAPVVAQAFRPMPAFNLESIDSSKALEGKVALVDHFLKGDTPATLKDVVVGIRVVIHAHKHGDMLHAAEVKVGTGTPVNH